MDKLDAPSPAMNPYAPPRTEVSLRTDLSDGAVTEGVLVALRQTRPWALAVGILCLAYAAFATLVGVVLLLRASKATNDIVGAAWFLGAASLYVYPGAKLWAYDRAISRLLVTHSSFGSRRRAPTPKIVLEVHRDRLVPGVRRPHRRLVRRGALGPQAQVSAAIASSSAQSCDDDRREPRACPPPRSRGSSPAISP
jgi:hypothetical protein